jgi:hypothetical protein
MLKLSTITRGAQRKDPSRPVHVTPVFDSDGVTIYHGHCIDVLRSLSAVDHVMTDPPYSEYTHSKGRRGGSTAPAEDGSGRTPRASFCRTRELGFEALSPELRASCAAEFGRLTTRWVLVFSDIESCHLWRSDLKMAGLEYIRTPQWHKLGSTPQFTGDRPAVATEAITLMHPPGHKRWNGGGSHGLWAHLIVLDRGDGSKREHTTQKPLSLMRQLVDLFTDEGETIIDPFCGSGTTLVAAWQLRRRAIGVEIDERYADIAAQRIERAQRRGKDDEPWKA